MPKLIIGGVDYGAYPTDAGDISYDNTSSGLSATNVQGAIDEVDGKIFYGYCTTEPTTSGTKKIWSVTLANGSNFALVTGVTVHIKFDYANDGSAYPMPNLNVNSTGEKPIYINDPPPPSSGIAPRWRAGQLCVFTYDGSKWLLVNTVQNAYRTPYSNSSSGLTATDVQGAIDEVNSNRAYVYRLTSTTSFYSACSGTIFTDSYGLGNFLDTKVHAVRNSFSTTAVNYIHDSVGGAIMFAQVFAYGASYYCGTVNTYHADNKIYGGFGFVNFQYMNGTYVIQYISNSKI